MTELCLDSVFVHAVFSTVISRRYRGLREVAARVPQPSLLPTVYQQIPGCGIRQLFLHNAGHRGRRHRCPKWVMNLQSSFFHIHHANFVGMTADLASPNSFHSLVIDVTMALDTLSLPVLEPLTPGRLLDVTVLALSCLYAGAFSKKIKTVEYRGMRVSSDICFFRCKRGDLHGNTAGG